jgi:iron(II)-dependent oxidoreductase
VRRSAQDARGALAGQRGARLATWAAIVHPRAVGLRQTLIDDLLDARRRLLALVDDLPDAVLTYPRIAIVNPPLWEIGHVAWFWERWALRHLAGRAPLRADADALWDSAAVAHDTRWELLHPDRAGTLGYMQAVLDAVVERLGSREPDADDAYFHRFATFHEDMHGEALVYTRQTLELPRPRTAAPEPVTAPLEVTECSGDAEVPGGTFQLGAARDLPFVFDNEKWAHPVSVAPFRIARTAVTQGQFAEFVEAGGYRRDALWSTEGLRWREQAGAGAPVYWRREPGGGWVRRHFDRWVPLDERAAMLHVSWFEAEAFCRFARRRLPTEAEWELAASAEPAPGGGLGARKRLFPWGDEPPDARRAHLDLVADGTCDVRAFPRGDSAFGCRQMIGNVWEWTADAFEPYPGFAPDPYKEYSAPWFGTHKVLRGGCFATRARLLRATWRNFYTPDRRDVLAGFRTCAL